MEKPHPASPALNSRRAKAEEGAQLCQRKGLVPGLGGVPFPTGPDQRPEGANTRASVHPQTQVEPQLGDAGSYAAAPGWYPAFIKPSTCYKAMKKKTTRKKRLEHSQKRKPNGKYTHEKTFNHISNNADTN